MNWTKWSTISEIVSSVAILVTLVYLAIQVQQATVAVNAEARTTQWQFQMGMLDHLIENPAIQTMWTQRDALTDEQKVVLGNWLFEFFGQREFLYLQHRSGVIDDATLETMISDVVQILIYPRIHQWWDLTSEFYFDRGFVELVNGQANEEALRNFEPWMPKWN
jgi:hypothetical protein